MKQLTIENSIWKLQLSPLGASLVEGQFKGQLVMPGPSLGLREACFPMLPYSNRILNRAFPHPSHTGKVQLNHPLSHALHGDCLNREWNLTQQSPHSAVFTLNSEQCPNYAWPWPLKAEMSYSLHNSTLKMELVLTNASNTQAQWLGGGFHPYFAKVLNGQACLLKAPVGGQYPVGSEPCIPIAPPKPTATCEAIQAGTSLAQTPPLDDCFTLNHQEVFLNWGELQLKLTGSQNLKHLVVYNPDKPYFACEPVANMNNAHNFFNTWSGHGLTQLQPQESLKFTLNFS